MATQKLKIAPSILAADMACLAEQVAQAEAGGADWIHVDVMDGRFVPTISVGPLVVDALRKATSLPLDVHLMTLEPERHLAAFSGAGADILTVHVEACPHLHRVVQQIKGLGCRAGVTLNPATPAALLEDILPEVDLVLIMTVNPGFGGQSFLKQTLSKVQAVRAMLERFGSAAELEVDGGITPETASLVAKAGASVLVAGTAVFRSREGIAEAIARMRHAA